jgi:hypothetical protein
MFFEAALGGLRGRVLFLEAIVEIFSGLLPEPQFYANEKERAYRYENPDVRHFCLLKAVRVVTALNAAIELVRLGYTQEMAALMRILAECTRHIEYVLDTDESTVHRSNVEMYLREFFQDIVREPEAEIKGVLIHEKIINEQLGKRLDELAQEYGELQDRIPAAQLFYRSSRAFSFYVHARYPECMDLYGGRPGRWHLRGMRGTPKDRENLATLDTFIQTASTTFVIMVHSIPQLRDAVFQNAALRKWLEQRGRS